MNRQRLFFLFCCILSLAACHQSFAQFTSAVLGIDGLTCSACSYGTERSIRKLDFIEDVRMELNKNIAEITFKKEKEVSIDALVKKVYDAGFSVRFVHATYHAGSPVSMVDNSFKIHSSTFYVLRSATSSLSGNVTMNFIKEKFIPKKELSKWKDRMNQAPPLFNKIPSSFYFVVIE